MYQKGVQYRVTTDGNEDRAFRLPRLVVPSVHEFIPDSYPDAVEDEADLLDEPIHLADGDIIEYVGRVGPRGHDKIFYDCFRYEGKIGEFVPTEWGTADSDFLDPVGK